MRDMINRQKAVDAVLELSDKLANEMLFIDDIVDEIENIPSAEPEPEEFEWCHDCKEYDQENHCCHRWTKVIRQTVEDMKSAEQKRKKGTWKNTALFTRECSECGAQFHELEYDNFCPNCGTHMR